MASTKEYLDFVLEQLSGLEEISFRAMMREYIQEAISELCKEKTQRKKYAIMGRAMGK